MLLRRVGLVAALLAVSAQCQASETFASNLVLASAGDFLLSGGVEVLPNPLLSLRSGQPSQRSVAAISVPLSAGITLTSVSFTYRYTAGFGAAGAGIGSNFTVRAAGVEVYNSPHLTEYPYSKSRPNYSEPIAVQAPVSIHIPAALDAARIEFDFENNDRNIQLLLPLSVNISCTGRPCAARPLVPTFIDSNMVLQRAPHRANLWGTKAVPGEHIVARLESVPQLSWSTAADATGGWSVSMDPQEASFGQTVSLQFGSPATGRKVTLQNVAFGDVYLW